ncbi:hypothetical protein HPB47_027826 [Ixodes persulcatus]|uniref:Uncharacterized protein n=1 Tax=Ixodes persulcatus TaxID=34615 RepID=A0AC60PW68_IXOPE|nr:hypothetical protein HPB47_027826 [Ixodes persulcatus]
MADQEDLQQQMKLLQEQIRTQQELIQRPQQQIQQQQHQLDGPVQQDPANANTTPPVPTGTAAGGGTPAAVISDAASLGVCRVAVKLRPFRADSPEVWFAQVEAQFSLARITQDRTRYDYAVARLNSRYANEIRDILDNPPAANLYQHLKTELTRRLSLSEDQKVHQLIQSAELAERKPSQLLRHMRALAGNMKVHNIFLRTQWLQRLPPHVQAILQAQPTLPLDQLADIADRVIEANIVEVTTEEDAVAADPEEDNQNQDLDLPGTSAKLKSIGAKNKTGPRNAGPQQPAKRKKVAEKQLEFMKGLLDEQRALRLCWENSRSSELALRERQLNLLENMQQDFASMRRRMEK